MALRYPQAYQDTLGQGDNVEAIFDREANHERPLRKASFPAGGGWQPAQIQRPLA
jgi:hypothetical protein